MAHVVDHRLGQLRLDARQPRPQVAHVLIELLHRHQRLLQLPHPAQREDVRLHNESLELPRLEISRCVCSTSSYKYSQYEDNFLVVGCNF